MKGIEIGLQYMKGVEIPAKVLFLCDCVPALESSFTLPLKKEHFLGWGKLSDINFSWGMLGFRQKRRACS